MDASIIAKFGGDVSDLQKATDEAEIIVKGFGAAAGRAVGEIGAGFGAAVAIEESIKAIKDLGASAIDSAEKEREAFDKTGAAISQQGEAWLALKDGATSAGSGIKEFAISALSVWPELGVKIGNFINTMRGISPEAQKQFADMANAAEVSFAEIQKAQDKFYAEMPARQAAANAKIAAADAALEETQEDSGAKVANLYATQAGILDSIEQTKQVIAAQEQNGVDTASANLKLSEEQAALEQNKLAIQQAQVASARDYITTVTQIFEAKKSSLTIEQQISALVAQQSSFEKDIADATGNAKVQEEYKNAAARDAVQIARDEQTIRKATSLSDADELAMFQYKNGIITEGNVLTSDQYDILVQQKAILSAQYQVDQDIAAGYQDGTDKNKADLAVHIQKLAIEQEELKTIKDQATASAALAEVVTSAAQAKAKGGTVGGVDQGNMTLSTDEYGNPILVSGDPSKKTGVYAAETDDGSWGNVSGMGTNHFNTGLTGVGYGNQQLQDSDTAKNEQAFVDSEKVDLQHRIQALENSDIKSDEDQVPALQAILAKLEQIHDGVVPKLAGS